MSTKEPSSPNLNTVLIGILLALSGWTLKTLVEQGVVLATITERVTGHDRDIIELKSRVDAGERATLRNAHYSPAPVRPNT